MNLPKSRLQGLRFIIIILGALPSLLLSISGCSSSNEPAIVDVLAGSCDELVELSGADQRELANGYIVAFDESVDVNVRSTELAERYSDLIVFSVLQTSNAFSGDSGDETLESIRCEPGVRAIEFNLPAGLPVEPDVSASVCDEPVELVDTDQRELANGYIVGFDESADVNVRSAELAEKYPDLIVYRTFRASNAFHGDSSDETLESIRCEPGVAGVQFNIAVPPNE